MAKKRTKKKKAKEPETPMERLKAQPLWFWGAICIFAGVLSNVANMIMIESQNLRGAEKQAAQLGSGLVAVLFILIGVVLIVMHFVRGAKKR